MSHRILLASAAAITLAGVAAASDGGGYFAGGASDIFAALPPPPAIGGDTDRNDHAVFDRTRRLAGTPRWGLAKTDASEATRSLLSDFSCAVGVSLSPEDAPRVTALIDHATPGIEGTVDLAKNRFRRVRPFMRFGGDLCVPLTPHLRQSYDYPSGHATKSWSIGLILARLAPDRAAEILGRARAFGESRVVCGVHNVSAVVAGRTTADVVVSALDADPAFRTDLALAGHELEALRSHGPRPDANVCRVERELTASTPW